MTDPIYGIGPRASGREPEPPQGGSGYLPRREGDAPDGVNGIRDRKRGRLIAIEGPDGVGKSEVAAAVGKALGGCDVISFPRDDAFTGPAIRAYLRRGWRVEGEEAEDAWSPLAFQSLQLANQMESMQLINAELAAGRDVVLCRYSQSALVYGQIDGLPLEFLERVHASKVQPDLSVLLDASAETCMARRARRDGDKQPERYEAKLERMRQIVDLYRSLWHREAPFTNRGRWVCVDAEPPLVDVIRNVLASVGQRPGHRHNEVMP